MGMSCAYWVSLMTDLWSTDSLSEEAEGYCTLTWYPSHCMQLIAQGLWV